MEMARNLHFATCRGDIVLEQKHWQKVVRYAFTGGELIVIFGLMVAGGIALDAKLQTLPLFTLLGTFIGLGLGIYRLVTDFRRQQRQAGSDESITPKKPPPGISK